MNKKNIASLSLDLDDKWTYLRTHGEKDWESFPSYLDIVIPRVLDFLKKRDLKITFFIVGQDAALEKNRDLLSSISEAGHEIGNHSFNHEPWLHLYSENEIKDEITKADEIIESITGQKPVGFRGPGFSLSKSCLHVLDQLGYEYDATTLPSLITPLARTYYLMTMKLSSEEKDKRRLLGGTFRDGLRSIKPYRWDIGNNGGLLEMPVTTMPIFRMPFHLSYLFVLNKLARNMALGYLSSALALCRLTATHPSLLMHPTDFLSNDDSNDLSFFPAMNIPAEKKLQFVSETLDKIEAKYQVVPLYQHARDVSVKNIKVVEPLFLNRHHRNGQFNEKM